MKIEIEIKELAKCFWQTRMAADCDKNQQRRNAKADTLRGVFIATHTLIKHKAGAEAAAEYAKQCNEKI